MLTIKNLRPERLWLLLLALTVALGFTGCKPPGARALLQGKKLLDQGKPADAIAPLQTAATLLATNANAWNFLALAHHAAGKPDAAATAYQNAIAANPNLAEPYFNFGCLLLEQGNPAAARNALLSFTQLRPRDANGWLKLGLAQLRARDLPNAERSYATALNLTQTPEGWNGLGLVQAGQRARAREAATSFSNALKLQPDYAPALLNLAVIYQSQNNRAAALEKYRAYADLKNSPPNQDAVAALVKSLDAELNPPAPVAPIVAVKTNLPPVVVAAKTNAVPVVSNRPALSQPKLMVVVSNPTPRIAPAPKTNLPVQVVTLTNDAPLKIAVDVSPTNPAPLFTNAVIVPPIEPKPKPVTIARYNFHASGKIKPGNRALATPAFERGIEAQDERSLTNALAAFREAALADPSYFKAHYNLAWTAYALKDWPTALEAYENALALDPASTDARYNFALTLKQAGYPLDAANELEKLLAKKSDDAAGHLLLANLYSQQLGGIELARPHYQKVLELKPQHPQATQIRYWLTENP
jgi:tetratricopeptide (TPR) repeat protein